MYKNDPSSPFINTTCLVTNVAKYENGGDDPHTQLSLQCLAMDAFNNTFPLGIEFFVSDKDKILLMAQSIKSGVYMDVCGQFSIIDGTMTLYDPSYEVLEGEQYDLSFHFADMPHGELIDIGASMYEAVHAATTITGQKSDPGIQALIDACNGKMSVGSGNASGDNRAENAAEAAIAKLFPPIFSCKSASSAMIQVCGSPDMTTDEFQAATEIIQERISDEAQVMIGMSINEDWQDKIQVTVLVGGFHKKCIRESFF